MTSAFVEKFLSIPVWELGRLCRVSNITHGAIKRRKYDAGEIPNPKLHFSVIAADNTNRYLEFYSDKTMDIIRDGDKVAIFDLKINPIKNPLGFDSIALPLGTRVVPQWFKELPFNVDMMLEKLVYRKLEVTFDALKWDLRPNKTDADEVFG
jgi:hypothetical protein